MYQNVPNFEVVLLLNWLWRKLKVGRFNVATYFHWRVKLVVHVIAFVLRYIEIKLTALQTSFFLSFHLNIPAYIQGVTKLSRHWFFAISARTRTFLTIGAGKLDKTAPKVPVLTIRETWPLGGNSRLETFLRPHLDDSLRCRVKDGLAAADGLGLQAKPKLITFQPHVWSRSDVWLAFTDAQLLTDHLMAHTTIKRSNLFVANGQVLFFSRLCPERKLLSDSNSNLYRNEVTLSLPEVKSPGEVRTKSLGTDSSSFPAPTVKKVRMRADMAKKINVDNFVTPCMYLDM